MSSVRITHRHVAAAVATVLAVTLGAGALAAPAAVAAPTAGTAEAGIAEAETAAEAPVAFPAGTNLAAAGKTGFLTRKYTGDKPEFRWTRYADGTSTPIDATEVDSTASDVVVAGDSEFAHKFKIVKLHDMATGAAPVTIDLGALGATYVKAVGPASVLARVKNGDGSLELRLLTGEGGAVTQKTVSGLPANAFFFSSPAQDGSVLVTWATGDGTTSTANTTHFGVVDLATATVTSTHETPTTSVSAASFSATHLTWREWRNDGIRLVTADRATGEEKRIPLYSDVDSVTGLVGPWAVYATSTSAGQDMDEPLPQIPLTAKSLTSDESVTLLDHALSALPAPDGTLLVQGGTVEHGEGMYRIALGQDGKPAAELVASTGEPTKIVYLGSLVPSTIVLDERTDPVLKWRLSRVNADVDLTITHRRTGQSFSKKLHLYRESAGAYAIDDQTFGIHWSEIAQDSAMGRDARIGEYDWKFTATPQNGIGPAVTASGAFWLAKPSDAHDFKNNRTPDLLARDASGTLWRVDTTYDMTRKSLVPAGSPLRVGGGWNTYDRIEAVGDLVEHGAADFVARDRDGVLWLYTGVGPGSDATFPTRTRIGGGWNTYTQFTGGSDLTGDGTPDLVATDKAGDLWLHQGVDNRSTPFAARKKIGHGWGIYNRITATGNLGGNAAGDLVARDKDGVLWLYLGKGDGTFAQRRKIGGGWNAYTDVVGIGDANKDGRPDLLAYGPGNTSYFYSGSGGYEVPFWDRRVSTSLNGATTPYNQVS
ncbi:FG-GAP repeat domain-containing protein [Streptomyces sp. R-07]|uniref:FG-GAP repeat domain-containing protein n=1 Tax=Streptomyces sp. R-07 TaxID=3404052 RepID=UPI003CEFB14A